MTNKTTTFSAPSKTKIKHILLIIVVVALACYFVPLPIPRWQTMTGECLRHGETVEVKMQCIELNYLFKDHVLYGDFQVQIDSGAEQQFALVGTDGRRLRNYAMILEDGSVSEDGHFQEFGIYQKLTTDFNRYNIITNRSLDCWVMRQSFYGDTKYPSPEEDCHLFLVSKDGDTDVARQELIEVVDYFEQSVRADK